MTLPTQGRRLPTRKPNPKAVSETPTRTTEEVISDTEDSYIQGIIDDNKKIIKRLKGVSSISGMGSDEFIGSLTSKDLMLNSWKTWAHVEEPIRDLTDLIRQLLSEDNKSEQVEIARREGGEKYKRMVLNIEAMVLKELNKTTSDKKVSRFYVTTEYRPILLSRVVNEIMGLGPLEPLYADEAITEIMANGYEDIQVEISGDLYKVPGVRFRDDEHLYNLCSSMLQAVGRKINVREPTADGRLADKSRINVTHPNIGGGKTNLTLRRHPTTSWTIKDMVDVGAMTEEIATELNFLIYNGCSAIIIGGTGSGKQLDDNTPLPTPTGWTTMGEVQIGDYVMSHLGLPTLVTGKFQDKPEVEAYRVTFSDGNSIIADADHNWLTYNRRERISEQRFNGRKDTRVRDNQISNRVLPQVRTTQEILDTIKTEEGYVNHAIKASQPVQYSINLESERLIDPYLFGLWLGDGGAGRASIASADNEIIEAFKEQYTVNYSSKYDWNISGGFLTSMKAMNVFNNKHIPHSYMVSPESVRRELLAGLLDSDGSVEGDSGSIKFYSSSKELTNQVRTLIQSLGYIVTKREKDTQYEYKGEMKQGKKAYTLTFQSELPVFKLGRKASKHKAKVDLIGHSVRNGFRYITSIEPYNEEEVSMHCITVDNEQHLYLAGDSFIPTHNTSALNALSGAFPLKDRILTIEDSMELKLNPKRTVIPFEARQASSSGENAISVRDLVKNSLRMRPDRIIIGEVRDGTAYDMLQAMNTGHDGSMTTVHANDALAGVDRLANLATESGSIDHSGVNSLIAGAVDLFIVVRKYHEDKSRRVSGVYEIPNRPSINPETGLSALDPRPLWEWIHTHTNDDGTIEGHYEKINEPSPGLVKKKRLDTARRMEIEEVYELSDHSS